MAKALDVYLHSRLVGNLIQDDGGQMAFRYSESWLNTPDASSLSQSLPLRRERFARKECRGFFAGILPEESKREIIARNLGISARNDFAMLKQIGGECAGAVSFIPAGDMSLFLRAADAGNSHAQYIVAGLYGAGFPEEPDIGRAIFYYQQAADQGHADAQFELALLYKDCHSLEKDPLLCPSRRAPCAARKVP